MISKNFIIIIVLLAFVFQIMNAGESGSNTHNECVALVRSASSSMKKIVMNNDDDCGYISATISYKKKHSGETSQSSLKMYTSGDNTVTITDDMEIYADNETAYIVNKRGNIILIKSAPRKELRALMFDSYGVTLDSAMSSASKISCETITENGMCIKHIKVVFSPDKAKYVGVSLMEYRVSCKTGLLTWQKTTYSDNANIAFSDMTITYHAVDGNHTGYSLTPKTKMYAKVFDTNGKPRTPFSSFTVRNVKEPKSKSSQKN